MSFYHSLMSKKFQGRTLFLRPGKTRSWGTYFLWAILAIAVFYGAIFLWPVVPALSNDAKAESDFFKVKILPQSSLSSISQQLSDQGIASNAFIFQVGARAILVGSKLKPGTYQLPLRASLGKVLLQIARGDRVRERMRGSFFRIPMFLIQMTQISAFIDELPKRCKSNST